MNWSLRERGGHDRMLEFEIDTDRFADIKVIGIGGGGNNAVNVIASAQA